MAQAGHLNDALPTIMVRGISDCADESKSAADEARWQPRAAANAAAFATTLAAVFAAELRLNERLRSARVRDMCRGHVRVNEHVLACGNLRIGHFAPTERSFRPGSSDVAHCRK